MLILESRQFDAIWVDGDHTFPVVAFDIINAIRLSKLGGWICVDDVRQTWNGRNKLGAQESFKTVEYLASTGLVTIDLILKRHDDKNLLIKPQMRKHIAVMRRIA
jgi:hypothetical protein